VNVDLQLAGLVQRAVQERQQALHARRQLVAKAHTSHALPRARVPGAQCPGGLPGPRASSSS
jgi:hypothetical protein